MFKIKPEQVQRQQSSNLYLFQPSIFNFTLQVSVEKNLFSRETTKVKWIYTLVSWEAEYNVADLHFLAFHIWKVAVCLRSKWSQQRVEERVEEGTQQCKRKLAAFSFSHFQQQPQKKATYKRKIWHLLRDVRATSLWFFQQMYAEVWEADLGRNVCL